jgi:hypothetical protein
MADYSREHVRKSEMGERAKWRITVESEIADYSRQRDGGLQSRAKWRITVESEMADYSRQRDGGLQSRAKSQENVRKSEMADYSRQRDGGLQSRAKCQRLSMLGRCSQVVTSSSYAK